MTIPTSGWENPDNHPDITRRPRPMFDAEGRPVTEAPPADPAPELDALMRPGNIQQAVTYEDDLIDKLAKIRQVAIGALDDANPSGWAVALDRIVRLAE